MSYRLTTSCPSGRDLLRHNKTGMAGKSSKSPWPLIRKLHEERFGPRID
jgi:hypothetical protein